PSLEAPTPAAASSPSVTLPSTCGSARCRSSGSSPRWPTADGPQPCRGFGRRSSLDEVSPPTRCLPDEVSNTSFRAHVVEIASALGANAAPGPPSEEGLVRWDGHFGCTTRGRFTL